MEHKLFKEGCECGCPHVPGLGKRASDMFLQLDEMRVALEIALPSMAHTYSGHEDPSVWVDGCGKCRVARLLTNPLKPKGEVGGRGNCSECGALVEHLYSLRCPACYDKLVAGMEKRKEDPPKGMRFPGSYNL